MIDQNTSAGDYIRALLSIRELTFDTQKRMEIDAEINHILNTIQRIAQSLMASDVRDDLAAECLRELQQNKESATK